MLGLIKAAGLAGLLMVASLGSAMAQQIDVDGDGRCPDDKLQQLPGMRAQAQSLAKGVGDTFVAKAGRLTQTSARASGVVNQPVQLFEKAILYTINEQTQKLLVGLIRGDRRVCGWADAGMLLFNTEKYRQKGWQLYANGVPPLKVSEGPEADKNRDNELNLKVVLQNLRQSGDQGPPVFDRPAGTEVQRLKQFFVFEVFAIEKANDPTKNNEERFFFLIGRSGDNRKLEGWINEDDVLVWNSRVAVFWNKTGEGKGFYRETQMRAGSDHVIEEPNPVREPADRVIGRFPVLDQKPSTRELAEARAQRAGREPQVDFFKVAMPGVACERTATGDQRCRSQIDQDQQRIALEDHMRRISTVDILFVLDATESMDPYFPATREAIQKFVREMNTDGMSLRVGVHVYGDYEGGSASVDTLQYASVIALGDPRDTEKFRRLDQITTFKDPNLDKPEGSFAALIKAAQHPYWNQNAGVRYIVHLGDHGNREVGKTSGKNNLVERYSESDVAAALRQKSIIYIPIAVQGTFERQNNEAFVAQANEIRRQLPTLSAPLRMTYPAGGGAPERPEERVTVIHKALTESVQLSRGVLGDLARQIACAQDPGSARCRQTDPAQSNEPAWMGEIRRGITQRSGLSESVVADIYNKSQTVASYFFPARTGNNRDIFNFWIAMEEDSLDRLAFSTGALCDNIDRTNGFIYLRNTLTDVFQVGSGDIGSPAELFEKRLFIPAYHLHPMLMDPWQKIQDELRLKTPEEKIVLKKSFCRSSYLIGELKQSFRIEEQELRWNEQLKRWEDTFRRRKPFNWKYEGGGQPLYYVPLNFLPK